MMIEIRRVAFHNVHLAEILVPVRRKGSNGFARRQVADADWRYMMRFLDPVPTWQPSTGQDRYVFLWEEAAPYLQEPADAG